MQTIDSMMREALLNGVFPGASIMASVWGKTILRGDYGWSNIYKGESVSKDTIFDLASLTKPLVTSLCMMKLVSDGKIGLDDRLGSIFSGFNGLKKEISIMDLLCHKSGLPAHRPYYEVLSPFPSEERKNRLKLLLREEPLEEKPGERTIYSDLGFMILRWIIEEVSGKSLKACFDEWVIEPLGLKNCFLHENGVCKRPSSVFAATEDCPFRNRIIQGETHDLNAFFAGGYDGHAGLFATMDDVDILLRFVTDLFWGRSESPSFDSDIARLFLGVPDGYERALGFDVPSKEGSSSGKFFSEKTVGHLGYTGTSFWLDLKTGLCVILLSNRVHPTVLNTSIREFRPKIHDSVAHALLL